MNKKTKASFTLVGKSIDILGKGVHDSAYYEQKTKFYAQLFKEGLLKNLMPYSLDKKAYAVIIPTEKGITYYAGVIAENEISGYESITVPKQVYQITFAKGGPSRLLFDALENEFFADTTLANSLYNGGLILEVLLNGNPADAEVELWVPIN